MDTESFDAIAKLAYQESGLQLAVEKTSMIQSRLRHRLKILDLESFSQYSAYVCSEKGLAERRHMISALTTNVSHFFREKHHFDILETQARTALLPKLRSGGAVRIWSAGCSNGQEALSIAITLLEIAPDIGDMNLKILGTDIDSNVIDFAKNARYSERLTSGIPPDLVSKYFNAIDTESERVYLAKNTVRSLVSFKELNLLSEWPMRQRMDIIFCRNVVIYFDQDTQNRLWPRFHRAMTSEGILFLGHSERIADPENVGFFTDGPTTYRPTR
ncbi:CheR family methyltransferase [uncultured Roseobacter sp.]|uniref:CheR family methyltransferase n=1 Tax=uncultured Roseobacter sp. TaxID=114847 RepID=UPI0026097F01|nr:CheR family methyltransferase [uncultured Roseobacter sp.]